VKVDLQTKLVILILGMSFLAQVFDIVDYYYQALVLSKYVVLARNTAFIISSLAKVYFILNKFDVVFFAIAIVMDFVFGGIFLLLIYYKQGNSIVKWSFCKVKAMLLLKDSWPLALSLFLISIYTKIDQVMVGRMLGVNQVGVYSVAVQLSEAWLFVPSILIITFNPFLLSVKKTNLQEYYKKLIQLYSFMCWIGIFVGFATIFFGEKIIYLLFGKEYIVAYKALIFNIWNGIAMSMAGARGIWMIGENLQRYRLYNNMMSVALNICLNYILIPKFGISGAAIATLFTQFCGTFVFGFLWKPMRQSNLSLFIAMNPIHFLRFLKSW